MSEKDEGIAVHSVLQNMTLELGQVTAKLVAMETMLFGENGLSSAGRHLKEVQDIDLVIQQISDMGRALSCILEADLAGASVPTATFAERMHLNELRQKLVGDHDGSPAPAATVPEDYLFFE